MFTPPPGQQTEAPGARRISGPPAWPLRDVIRTNATQLKAIYVFLVFMIVSSFTVRVARGFAEPVRYMRSCRSQAYCLAQPGSLIVDSCRETVPHCLLR